VEVDPASLLFLYDGIRTVSLRKTGKLQHTSALFSRSLASLTFFAASLAPTFEKIMTSTNTRSPRKRELMDRVELLTPPKPVGARGDPDANSAASIPTARL